LEKLKRVLKFMGSRGSHSLNYDLILEISELLDKEKTICPGMTIQGQSNVLSHSDNFDNGKYGYAFFNTSTMAYKHKVLWEGFHFFN
jgi:hypothetical protein